MQQDIRELFKDEDVSNKKLPQNHKKEFFNKLNALSIDTKRKPNIKYIYKYVAAILIFFSIGYIVVNQFLEEDVIVAETELEQQLKEVEQIYLKDINKEWQNFVALATDENLIKRYEEKLKDLDTDYQEITIKFKQNKNNILIIEALVDNLKTRLQILKDIQEHINLLNQKTKSYETIIL